MKSLEEILSYRNENVMHRFLMVHPMPREEADQVFEDMLRFLWLSAVVDQKRLENPEVPDISIAEGMYIIDEIWHEFVLLTKMYTDFCQIYLGRFVHHPPELDKFKRNKPHLGEDKAIAIFLEELIEAVIEYFDETIAVRWFDEYHKYVPENYHELLAHHTR